MTSKERAALRGQANTLDVLFQVGKGGISDTLIEQTDGALRTRELIKLRVLTETSPLSAREAAEELAAKTGSEVVQVIGGVMVLYRYNPKLHEEKPKAAAKKKTSPADERKKKYKAANKKKSPFEDKKGRDKRIVKKASK
ncbi:MAG: YhbY family RNA-binding protein [Ruminococcaceae bacterium]|nr:YhbY family RNA-binding protein [Oscillospiraceae bacterium]MBR3598062.1 YhbY family RNA-binding protein [Clostridia bacterium]